MSLNERISEIIEYTQLSASEFADAVEVQRSSISHITSGRNKPSLDFLMKVREKYPELQWEWLILGEGEMLSPTKPQQEEGEIEAVSTPSMPDLFALINDENFGVTETEDRILPSSFPNPQVERAPELPKSSASSLGSLLSDSQPLEENGRENETQPSKNEPNKVKRIVLFYENGKFESFEP
ncbi:helix-turn-helix domain-containing protein [Chryseobacterium sp. A321]